MREWRELQVTSHRDLGDFARAAWLMQKSAANPAASLLPCVHHRNVCGQFHIDQQIKATVDLSSSLELIAAPVRAPAESWFGMRKPPSNTCKTVVCMSLVLSFDLRPV